MYRIWMSPSVHEERRSLPGVVRQRLKRAIESLASEPRPSDSRPLRLAGQTAWELRRIRDGNWRIIHAVDDVWQEVAVLAIRKRPPYDYADLDELSSDL